jgi:hypothetical protein
MEVLCTNGRKQKIEDRLTTQENFAMEVFFFTKTVDNVFILKYHKTN